MRNKLLTMLELQDAMNARVNPVWREANNEWYRAIWTECAEMLDHYGWKWWKHQQPDLDQVRLELVDIIHFAMSDYLLQDNATSGRPALYFLLLLLQRHFWLIGIASLQSLVNLIFKTGTFTVKLAQ